MRPFKTDYLFCDTTIKYTLLFFYGKSRINIHLTYIELILLLIGLYDKFREENMLSKFEILVKSRW